MMQQQQETATLMARVLVAHDRDITDLRQALEVDVLIADEAVKIKVHQKMSDYGKGKGKAQGKRLAALREVLEALKSDQVSGTNRILERSDKTLGEAVLRFKPQKESPKHGYYWKFTLALGLGCGNTVREAFSDLVASGGSARVLTRRPVQKLGPLVNELAGCFGIPGNKAKGKGKDKGKDDFLDQWYGHSHDKGQDYGKGGLKANGGGKGYGKGYDKGYQGYGQEKGKGYDSWGKGYDSWTKGHDKGYGKGGEAGGFDAWGGWAFPGSQASAAVGGGDWPVLPGGSAGAWGPGGAPAGPAGAPSAGGAPPGGAASVGGGAALLASNPALGASQGGAPAGPAGASSVGGVAPGAAASSGGAAAPYAPAPALAVPQGGASDGVLAGGGAALATQHAAPGGLAGELPDFTPAELGQEEQTDLEASMGDDHEGLGKNKQVKRAAETGPEQQTAKKTRSPTPERK